MARHPHPIVEVILGALLAEGADAVVSRVATDRLDVDLTLTAADGRRVVVNVREEQQ
ncbi:hypothetical protein GCM10010399_64130 [Dactylosporangium fulvum]|uniref:Uncharacterized protein n=1 Tax=Dactylosporangium fulvum TaxID=53359 RepID=A0ABY5W8F4_9ACTN|nr:hypothetical protein [Dactylosporangium fulvum]UWP85764.1 hypothetical protein Dfulv_16590 [Dactylosporangium fulvum]